MAQLTDDCFAFGGPMLTIDDAVALMRSRFPVLSASEKLAIGDADGRVLAADLVAACDVPSFDNSAVDGFAVRFGELNADGDTRMPVAARIIAGETRVTHLPPRSAARIFTGAPMPDGADTVFMQEDVREDGGYVLLPPGLKRGANARAAGEDIAKGAVALRAGHVLRPQDLALAAAVGITHALVKKPLRVAVFSTGNELADAAATLEHGAIFDANRPMLIALLRRAGLAVSDLGILRDDPLALADALQAAAAQHDVILTTGGVSTGEEDHVKAAVEKAGALVFWRIGIKPGRPVALGLVRGGENDAVFCGLPGNPVAAFVTFVFIVRPLLTHLAGAEAAPLFAVSVRAGFDYKKKKDRREFVRVSLTRDGDAWIAMKHKQDGAGVITSLTATDGLIALREDITSIRRGDVLPFYPYATLLA
ncbi:MAG: molybdopterin molybdotransferase MoeA [Beijerinckiaceae bacterium]